MYQNWYIIRIQFNKRPNPWISVQGMVKNPMKNKKLLVRVCLSSGHAWKRVWVVERLPCWLGAFCIVEQSKLMKELNPVQYPTLVKYQPKQIQDAVIKLQARYPDMTEQQCLLNLEMDLSQQEQMS